MITFGEAGPRRVTLRHRKHAILLSAAGAGREGPRFLNDPGSDVSDDGSAGQAPGHWPGTRDAAACPRGTAPTWHRRALLLAALLLGVWALLVAWSSTARADEPAAPPACEVVDVQLVDLAAPPAEPPVDRTAVPLVSGTAAVPPDVGAATLCPAPPPEADPPPAPDAEPPAPPVEPVEPVAPPAPTEPPAPPSTPAAGPADGLVEGPASAGLPPVDIPVDLPVVDAVVPAPVAADTTTPDTTTPDTTTPDTTTPDTAAPDITEPGTTPAGRGVPAVTPESPARAPVCTGVPVSADSGRRIGPAGTESGAHGDAAPLVHASTVGDEAPVPASVAPGGTPAGSPVPLAPAHLPSPMPAPAPAGSSAAASSGSTGCGPGQTEHADLTYAVLGRGFTADDAQASVRPTQGFAGAVVGGADDPGVRPG
jgi:hypothetical protein